MAQENKEQNFVINIVDSYVKDISGNWWTFFVTGLLFIVFGIIFLIWPEKTLIFIAYTIGLMAILVGFWNINAAMKVKRIEKRYEDMKKNFKSNFFE
ncbi:MAG: DUF308 domain-containing protein [Candidatus Pacebacteria bacterium]|nr:DUF308 domain-containing protein [Candidatus Paceibacterota bacterium]